MAEYASGNIFIREMRFEDAGDSIGVHGHNFPHTLYVARGALRVSKLDDADNVVRVVEKRAGEGFNWVLIEAGVRHGVTALAAGSIGHCIYSHRLPQALVERMGIDPEFDAMLKKLIGLANVKFGDIVQQYDGWQKALN